MCCLATSYFYAALLELCYVYVRRLSLLQLRIWASYRHFIDRLPEAMCCCLQTYTVNDALLVMYCMCLLAVIITSADIRKLWVQCICMLFTNTCMLPEAICCCLQTCYIYGVLLTLPCTYIPTFMATTANTW